MEWDIFNERIKKVIEDVENNEIKLYEAWSKYLKEKLSFPFEAEVAEYQDPNSILYDVDRVQVIDVYRIEEMYGIIVKIKINNNNSYFPLCDFEAVNLPAEEKQALKDYRVWFANR
jgi:hypothetical protein